MARLFKWTIAATVVRFGAAELPPADAAALEADDVCAAGEDCSLELRQLRSREKMAAASHHESTAGADFGPNAKGKNMWQTTTWEDILLEIQSNASQYPVITPNTQCDQDTYGTCSLLGCATTRGATECTNGKCMCAAGYCARGGACYPKDPSLCVADTTGTCAISGCSSSRGETKCKSGKCLCKEGGCAWKGACFPAADTGGSCTLLSCSSSRGPTTCNAGRCLCQSGFVAVQGRCEKL